MSNLNDIFFTPAANQELTYDQVLEDVQRYFAENHASTIAEAGEGNAERATSLLKELMEHYIVKRKYAVQCRNSAVLEQAYASGYRTAVQMFAAGLGPQPPVPEHGEDNNG